MPRCPSCRRSFRVMEDEDDGQHDCPFCGYSAHEEKEEEDERDDFDPDDPDQEAR